MQQARSERARIDTLDAEAQGAVLLARADNARAQLESASSAFERSKTLLQKGGASSSQFELAQAARELAAANLREAEAILAAHEHIVDGSKVDFIRSNADLEIAQASVPQRKAAERSIEIDLERTTIRSPIDGVVVGRKVNEGQTVAASLEAPVLFTIAGDLQRMEIYARVDESDIGKIRVGQKAQFSVDAYPTQRFAATVSGIRKAPEVTQNVVTYTVVLATTNPDNLLLPGMTATVNIVVAEAKDVLRIPMTAPRFVPAGGEGVGSSVAPAPASGWPATVWLLGGAERPVPVNITLGEDDGAYAALLTGDLKEGDQLAVGEIEEAPQKQLFGIRLGF